MLKQTARLNNFIQCLFVGLIFLSLFDLVATIYWVSAGEAQEANPVMNFFIKKSFCLFVFIKLSLTFGGILILDKFKNISNKLVFNVSLYLVLIYAMLAGWHIVGVFMCL